MRARPPWVAAPPQFARARPPLRRRRARRAAGPGARVCKLTDGDLALPAASYMRVNQRLIEVNGEEVRNAGHGERLLSSAAGVVQLTFDDGNVDDEKNGSVYV